MNTYQVVVFLTLDSCSNTANKVFHWPFVPFPGLVIDLYPDMEPGEVKVKSVEYDADRNHFTIWVDPEYPIRDAEMENLWKTGWGGGDEWTYRIKPSSGPDGRLV